jgi:diguanylate cyclase (GGDEF)-like protein
VARSSERASAPSTRRQAGLFERSSARPWVIVRCLLIAGAIIGAAAANLLQPIDDVLVSWRFSALTHRPTGDIVFLEIDASSLQKLGVWPWPRTVHAEIIDRLIALGAKSMAFDIDFSAASTPENDAAFAAALGRAGGYAMLAAFEQPAGGADGRIANTPIPQLAAESEIVSVEVPLDPDGLVRGYPLSRPVDGQAIPSLGSALARLSPRGDRSLAGMFGVDFGIDAEAVDRISVADLLSGKVERDRLKGRDIVIGSSAQELRDFFMVPRFGLISGGLVHILAAETLKQGLALRAAPFWPSALVIVLLACLAASLDHRLNRIRWLASAAAISLATELVALALQQGQALQVGTAGVQLALAAFVLTGVFADLRFRRKQHAAAEREREFARAMLRQVIADNFDGVIIVDEANKILAMSTLAQEALGGDLAGRDALAVLPQELATVVVDAVAGRAAAGAGASAPRETAIAWPGAATRFIEFVVTVSTIAEKSVRRVACLTFRDVTERRAQASRLKFLATHDPMTGAWAKDEFVANVEARLCVAEPSDRDFAVICIELRRFHLIADVLGLAVGEEVLRSIVARLRADGCEMIARIGDTTFALALAAPPEPRDRAQACQSLIARLCDPYEIDGRRVAVGVSLGVATSATSGRDALTLLAHARIALSAARKIPGNHCKAFSSDMEAALQESQWIETALRRALPEGQFSLHYQPQVDLASGELIGAEALIRWRHPERGFISPAKFIAIAEEIGLIVDIGRWVLQTALREAARWPEALRVAVNASPIQFETSDLLDEVNDAIARAGLGAERVVVEITEGVLIAGDSAISAKLDRLRARGVAIALDDFGTGYSSLSYLDRLPIDEIKIDRSFVQRITNDAGAAAIVRSVLSLASQLGKLVVAEGVETAAQAELLATFGCEAVQGYYFGRPMPAEEFRKLFGAPVSRRVEALAG